MFYLFLFIFGILFIYSIFGNYSRHKINIINYGLIFNFLILAIIALGVLFYQDLIINFYNYPILKINILSAYFVLLFIIVCIATLIYSNYYFEHYLHQGKILNFYYPLFIIFLYSMLFVLISNEAISFLIYWEIMSLSSFLLVIHEYYKDGVITKGLWYLIITHIGMFCILMSFVPLIGVTGSTIFTNWHLVPLSNTIRHFVFFTAFIGFGSKSGLFPLHIWLPKAHPIAPSNISALMSGFMVKIPVLMIFKFIFEILGYAHISWGITIIIIGSLSAFFGIFYGLIQSVSKKLLAYSTIENMGIIYIGMGISIIGISIQNYLLISIGFLATMYHTLNHAITKTMMFLLVGSIIERSNSRTYYNLGGLIKQLPMITFVFLLGSLAMAGIPPFNGFNSELLTFYGLINGLNTDLNIFIKIILIISLGMLAAMSALSFITFGKFFSITFLGNPREKLEINTDKSSSESFAFIILIFAILLLSVFPGFIKLITDQILGTVDTRLSNTFFQLYILKIGNLYYIPIFIFIFLIILIFLIYLFLSKILKNSITMDVWNCGYPKLITNSQYKSDSFIQPIVKLYKDLYLNKNNKHNISKLNNNNHKIYLNNNQEIYKKLLAYILYIRKQKFIVKILYQKLFNIIIYIHTNLKLLQNGNLQYYIGYILITLSFAILIFTLTN